MVNLFHLMLYVNENLIVIILHHGNKGCLPYFNIDV
jgi:hypothetical protein